MRGIVGQINRSIIECRAPAIAFGAQAQTPTLSCISDAGQQTLLLGSQALNPLWELGERVGFFGGPLLRLVAFSHTREAEGLAHFTGLTFGLRAFTADGRELRSEGGDSCRDAVDAEVAYRRQT